MAERGKVLIPLKSILFWGKKMQYYYLEFYIYGFDLHLYN